MRGLDGRTNGQAEDQVPPAERTNGGIRGFAVLAIVMSGCGPVVFPSPPPEVAPSVRLAPPSPSEPDELAMQKAILAASGVYTHELDLDSRGRISHILPVIDVSKRLFYSAAIEPVVLAWYATVLPSLGYGRLGPSEPTMLEAHDRFVARYVHAEGCPGLVAAVRLDTFDVGPETFAVPGEFVFVCPSEPNAEEKLEALRSMPWPMERRLRGPMPPDRLVRWLASEGHPVPSVVTRNASGIRIEYVGTERRLVGSPGVSGKVMATKIAELEGLPKLDRMLVHHASYGQGRESKAVVGVTLYQDAPPRDGTCIDPVVNVFFVEPNADLDEPNVARLERIEVICEREPSEGSAPADSNRVLPKTIATSADFLAECHFSNPYLGVSVGLIVDARGDAYLFRDRIRHSPVERGLAVKMRYGKRHVETLPSRDVERLVAQISLAEREKTVTTQRVSLSHPVFESCFVYRRGSPRGAPPIRVTLDSDDQASVHREGPASEVVRSILSGPRAHMFSR